MTKKREKDKKPLGRPKIQIDWKEVDNLLAARCSGTEIAGFLGIHQVTLYEKCLEEKGQIFSNYSAEKYAKGDSLLRAHQFAKALGFTGKGDNALLIWLGKNRLNQREKDSDETRLVLEADKIKPFLDQISSLQSHLKIDETKEMKAEKSECDIGEDKAP